MSEHLEEQAAGLGIDLGFHDIGGIYHAAKPEVLEGIIKALQQDGFSDDLYADTLVAHENGRESLRLPAEFHGAAEVCLEDEAGGRQVLPLNHGEDGVLWLAAITLCLRKWKAASARCGWWLRRSRFISRKCWNTVCA